ncbi:MAG TPA: S9 family peptidase [Thermoanaerobaculia bacterium]|jgi:dipeptidyl aminopeptidase/acylaminoacyl peptidase|nr:S9 family peptidase [Thermoanaerobaculia bacterium]
MRKITPALALALAGAAAANAQPPHPFTAHDLHEMQRLSDPQPSPDGRNVAFVVRTTDFAANKGRNDIWLVGLDGTGLTQLTSDPAADTNPRWSPDGKSLYFLSARSGTTQVWRIPIPGTDKQALQVTDLPFDVSNLTLSPDGKRIAFSLEVYPDCSTLACTKERLDAKTKSKTSAQLYDGGFVRHWDSWSEGLRNHLHVATLGPDGKAGEPVDLSRALAYADVPSRPDGGAEEWAFSPDSRKIVFAARLAGDKNREEPWSTNFDLYEVPVDGSAAPRNLTAANLAWDSLPAFSPDGKSMAYLRMKRPGYEADRFWIVLRDLATGKDREVAADWDHSPEGVVFSPDGRTLYATAADTGQYPLFAIDVATGKVRKLVAEGHTHNAALAGKTGDRLVFGRDTLTAPVDLYTVKTDGSDLKQITHFNKDRLAAIRFGEGEQFHFAGANGDTVYGWAFKPAGFEAGKKYPVALLIHGGPQGSFNNEFHYRWNPQIYTGAGYAVLTIDFHGSVGYGQAFTDAINQDWGGKPLEDLQKGLAAAIARYPWIDGDRAAALGASYGGYMTNWIAGNWPDRFRCLVTHDGILDQRMMYYGTEELWFPEWEQGGPYWKDPQGYEKYNPVNFVEKWKTPTLVIHSGHDYRIPDNQGFAAFNALQRRGIPSQFLYFPDENHFVLKPANALRWHEVVLAWLDRWLKGA